MTINICRNGHETRSGLICQQCRTEYQARHRAKRAERQAKIAATIESRNQQPKQPPMPKRPYKNIPKSERLSIEAQAKITAQKALAIVQERLKNLSAVPPRGPDYVPVGDYGYSVRRHYP
jgi:hypothetical protein